MKCVFFLLKVMTHKLCQNANFENGGTTIQVSTLHVLLNIFFNIFTAKGTRCKKSSHVILRPEES